MSSERLNQLRALEREAKAELERTTQGAPTETMRQALLDTKVQTSDDKLNAARRSLTTTTRRAECINAMMGDAKGFGLSHPSIKVPMWLAAAVVLALCAVFVYAALRIQ